MLDVIIIGAGPAGLTAAIYGIRAGMSVLVLEETTYGGQIGKTAEVENYPAIQKISGWQLAQQIYDQAVAQNVEIKFESAMNITLEKNEKIVHTASNSYRTKTIIIANGAKRRKLNCEGEEEFTGRGVSYCATCDGAFFKNKDVAVIGGGNTALEDALYLSNICRTVYLIHRNKTFRSENHLIKSLDSKSNIKLILSHSIKKINGDSNVFSLTALNVDQEKEIPVSGVFIAIGLEPDNQRFSGVVNLDSLGYIIASEDCRTNVEGIFAAGDTRTKDVRQIVTATADGAVAAVNASSFILS